jgi:hypothetical protein
MEPRNGQSGCRRAPNTRKTTVGMLSWQGIHAPGGVGDLWQAWKHWVRHPGGPASGLAVMPGPHGEPMGHDREGRVQGVGQLHRTKEAFEQGSPLGPAEKVEGRELAKGNVAEQTRSRTQGRGILSQALSCVRQAPSGACASRPEAGARCGSTARRDLCGGCRVTGIPTATARDTEDVRSV